MAFHTMGKRLECNSTAPMKGAVEETCKLATSLLDRNERVDLAVGVFLGNDVAGVQEGELEDEREALDPRAGLLDELCRCRRRTTRGNEVVHNEDNVVRAEGVLVDLQLVGAVLERVGLGVDLAGSLPGLRAGTKPAPSL